MRWIASDDLRMYSANTSNITRTDSKRFSIEQPKVELAQSRILPLRFSIEGVSFSVIKSKYNSWWMMANQQKWTFYWKCSQLRLTQRVHHCVLKTTFFKSVVDLFSDAITIIKVAIISPRTENPNKSAISAKECKNEIFLTL